MRRTGGSRETPWIDDEQANACAKGENSDGETHHRDT
jgi:hypothetical protein